jgi:hypothetical protein
VAIGRPGGTVFPAEALFTSPGIARAPELLQPPATPAEPLETRSSLPRLRGRPAWPARPSCCSRSRGRRRRGRRHLCCGSRATSGPSSAPCPACAR